MRVLFRAAAGADIGFGHLVRCRSLARALNADGTFSIRGAVETRLAIAAQGLQTAASGLEDITRQACDLLVVDDPCADQAALAVAAARAAGVPVASLHDVGLAYVEADLTIDGSIAPRTDAVMLAGPIYAALDPDVAALRATPAAPRDGVLVTLGGGAHVATWGRALADAVLARNADLRVRIATGFAAAPEGAGDGRIEWVRATSGLAALLRRSAVVVSGGGLTLYEAAALETPAVGLAVVDAQRATIRGFALRDAVVDGGHVEDEGALEHIADAVCALTAHPLKAQRLADTAARIVDGRGVFRVADALRQLVRAHQERHHAA